MNQYRSVTALVISIFCMAVAAYADIAPGPGYTRVYSNLVLDPQDDFRDFRFFLESGMTLEEISIHEGNRVVIPPKGGGARYNVALVYAIPRKSLTAIGENLTSEKLSTLESDLSSGRIAGAVKLLTHDFSREVRDIDVRNIADDAFRLEETKDGVVAVPISITASPPVADGPRFGVSDLKTSITPLGVAFISTGVVVTLGLLAFGVFRFRKRHLQ